MNVSRIQALSEQHKSLKRFHRLCNHNDVELAVKVAGKGDTAGLDYVATSGILARVRSILLDRICEIEKEIKKEVGV